MIKISILKSYLIIPFFLYHFAQRLSKYKHYGINKKDIIEGLI